MPRSNPPLISQIVQACVVVRDFNDVLAGWVRLGIGPFKTWTFAEPKSFATTVRGRPLPWSVRLGATWCGAVQLEIIQPLAVPSLAGDFLTAGGQGVQHLMGRRTTSFGRAVARLRSSGIEVAEGGTLNVAGQLGSLTIPPLPRFVAARFGTHFVYFDTSNRLGAAVELVRFPPGLSMHRAMSIGKPDARVPSDGRVAEAPFSDPLLGDIRSVGIMVSKARGAAEGWEELLGVGPWRETEAGGSRVLVAQLGETRIELTEPAGPLTRLPVPGGYVGFTTSLPLEVAVRRLVDLGCGELWRGEFLGNPRALVDGVAVCGSALAVTAARA